MVLDQYGPRSSAFDLQAMSRMFGFGVFVRGCDEGNDEICKSGEELGQFVSIVLLNKAIDCFTQFHHCFSAEVDTSIMYQPWKHSSEFSELKPKK
jgi:hypothetical protein